MPPLPELLIRYWDQTDNFDSEGAIILAEDFDGPLGDQELRSWSCPTCNDWWKSSIQYMNRRSEPCSFCNGRTNRKGFPHIDGRGSVASEFPHIAEKFCLEIVEDGYCCYFAEAQGHEFMWPVELLPNSKHRPVLRCGKSVNEIGLFDETGSAICRHVWWPRMDTQCSQTSTGRNPSDCPSCTKGGGSINSLDMKNALSVTNPVVGAELVCHPRLLTSDEIRPGSDRHCYWQCLSFDENGDFCGHFFRAQVNPRTKNSTFGARTECPACENLEVHEDGRNSLSARFPNAAADWDYDLNGEYTPENVTFGGSYDAHWRCQKTEFTDGRICGHDRRQRIYSKTMFLIDGESHVSCPGCCPGGGYKRNLPGYFYVLRISSRMRRFFSFLLSLIHIRISYPLYKCGISNVPLDRIYRLAKSLKEYKLRYPSWRYSLVSIHYHEDGEVPLALESMVKNDNGKRRHERTPRKPFSGGDEVYIRNMWDFDISNGMIEEGWESHTDELRDQIGGILNKHQ